MTPITPTLGRDVYIAPTAYVAGRVTIGDECSFWHHVLVRGDVSNIRIGNRVNVQDATVIHTETDVDLEIEDDVAIGHRAVVHCKRVGAGTLIGIGSIVLDRCEIGRGCLIAAGAVVAPRTIVPDGSVVMGVPGKIVRQTTPAEREYHAEVIRRYLALSKRHAAGEFAQARSTAGGMAR